MKKEKPTTLVEAVLQVMGEVKNIDKSMVVGSGANSYKGIADKDVKTAVGQAMERAGLVIMPKSISPKIQVDRWEEQTQYGVKAKQSVFTEVIVTYELRHVSGESIELTGYGHGVDSQDKGAGKAMTYALKTLLLYLFMIPTGKIDDADATHSNDVQVPNRRVSKQRLTDDQLERGRDAIAKGEYTLEQLFNEYELTPAQLKKMELAFPVEYKSLKQK